MTLAPADSYRTAEWVVSPHARKQCAERCIAIDELMEVLRRPDITSQPAAEVALEHGQNPDDLFFFKKYGIVAVTDVSTHTVITVLVGGAGKDSWEEAAPKRKSTLPAPEPVEYEYKPMTRPSSLRLAGNTLDRVRTGRVQVTNTLDFLHPVIREGVEAELARLGKTCKDVRILSRTKVEIL